MSLVETEKTVTDLTQLKMSRNLRKVKVTAIKDTEVKVEIEKIERRTSEEVEADTGVEVKIRREVKVRKGEEVEVKTRKGSIEVEVEIDILGKLDNKTVASKLNFGTRLVNIIMCFRWAFLKP